MCPFDTYKVYKRGGNVRVDTTLVGFDNNRWQRGDRTYIFRGQGEFEVFFYDVKGYDYLSNATY